MKGIIELVNRAHNNSKSHGFWSHDEGCPETQLCECVNLDFHMKANLILSETAEALEEYRLGDDKRGGKLGTILFAKPDGARSVNDDAETPRKPEGFIVELADVAIRVFDLTGKLNGADILTTSYEVSAAYRTVVKTISSALFDLNVDIVGAGKALQFHMPGRALDGMAEVLVRLEDLARHVNGDLDEAIGIKMAYNATRPHKHGKTC